MKMLYNCIDEDIRQAEKTGFTSEHRGNWSKCLSHAESTAVIKFEQQMFKLLIHLAYITGCRRSELLALERGDFDYKNRQVSIYKGSHYTKNNGVYTENRTKNENEIIRIISLTAQQLDSVTEFLKITDETRKVMGSKWEKSDRLFISVIGGSVCKAGGPMNPTTATQWFSRFLKKHELKPLPFHGLRHSCASYMLNKGTKTKFVAERLGDTEAMIEKRYGHIYQSTNQEIAKLFDEF